MNTENEQENPQAALWNGDAGRAWVEAQETLDRMFQPIEDMLMETIPPGADLQVLDLGCGTGSTTLAAARRLGPDGRATGLDISAPMIALARARAESAGSAARFLCGDARTHAFAPQSFDLIFSRFGVMFFDDPVGAVANLKRAARRDGKLIFIAWRRPGENPFMTTAERAAAPLLPNLPARGPDEPGQFAFAERGRVQRILHESGWREIGIEPFDAALAFPEKDLLRYITRMGPLGRLLAQTEEATRKQVIETAYAAFAPFVHGDEVRFTAACWKASARA
jgi:SAM-dependent methyltransferase